MEKFDKAKFLFTPARSTRGRPSSPVLHASLVKPGSLSLNKLTMDILDIPLGGAMIQLFVDYEKRAIAFKLLKDVKLEDAKDASVRFVKPILVGKYKTPFFKIAIQSHLKAFKDVKLPLDLELKKYSDTWTKDLWYVTIPRSTPEVINN